MLIENSEKRIEALRGHLSSTWPNEIRRSISTKAIIEDERYAEWADDRYACFFAPLDWVNESANIVLIGITPGMQQAEAALLVLQAELKKGATAAVAARAAKAEASFKGEMREIGARLMDHFSFNRLFGLRSTAELFGPAADRVHYTSALRYPVLERKPADPTWKNYGGDAKIVGRPAMRDMVDRYLARELALLPNAWLVPFGPVPTIVMQYLASKGKIDADRILPGLNHPSGTHWNRHNCQLDLVEHGSCAPNVGCGTIQNRSRLLREKVALLLEAG